MFLSSMKKLFKKPFVHIGLKNVKCYCCIFKDRKVIYYVHQRSKSTVEPSCSTPSISLDILSSPEHIQHSDNHQDKTEDLQIYCCCYHLLKSFLKN